MATLKVVNGKLIPVNETKNADSCIHGLANGTCAVCLGGNKSDDDAIRLAQIKNDKYVQFIRQVDKTLARISWGAIADHRVIVDGSGYNFRTDFDMGMAPSESAKLGFATVKSDYVHYRGGSGKEMR